MNKTLLLLPAFLLLFNLNSHAQIYGCTDPLANNYNPTATNNDGSCSYNASNLSPVSSFNLAGNLNETSGLIRWNDWLWTHNDSQDTNLYALDTLNGNVLQTHPLTGVLNTDWEEISQDDNYIYIGDFGNNLNGNRTDLKILRIDKISLLAGTPMIDTIYFSYSNQTVFTPTGGNNTDFDCEAFVVATDSIYLFSKQWVSNESAVYALPKTPGTYIANLKFSHDVEGLITGAVYLEAKNLVVLCGYSNLIQPFVYLLYDFSGKEFFAGNKRKVGVSLPFHQAEGITTTNGLKYYLSNEFFSQPPIINVQQKLHIFDLSPYLGNFLSSDEVFDETVFDDLIIYPVPSGDMITVQIGKELIKTEYVLSNQYGEVVLTGTLSQENPHIDISKLPSGLYMLKPGKTAKRQFKVIKN